MSINSHDIVTIPYPLLIGEVASRVWDGRAADVRVLLEDSNLLDATGSRHMTQPTHAGVGGHHTTVSPLFFIAYPQTRVPAPSVLGPCADATTTGSSTHSSTALK